MTRKIVTKFDRLTNALLPCKCKEARLENIGYAKKLLNNWNVSDNLDNGEWSVGVTTAPRRESNLPMCLNSLRVNGWLPTVYAEPGTNLSGIGQCNVVQNKETLGPWFNWLRCASELAQNGSKYVLIVQDDTVIVPGARNAVERLPDPLNAGFLSLYLSSCQSHFTEPGIFKVHKSLHSGKWETSGIFWGACAWVFETRTLRKILKHPTVQNWKGIRIPCSKGKDGNCRHCGNLVVKNSKNGVVSFCQTQLDNRPNSKVCHIDTVISNTTRQMGLNWYAFGPSAAQHVSKYSTIGTGTNSGNRVANSIVSDWSKVFKANLTDTGDYYYDERMRDWSKLTGSYLYPISQPMWRQLNSLIPNKRVLEFGSGLSTWLMQGIAESVTSIEQDGYVASLTGAKHCPLVDGWYGWKPEGKYDVILIDGPARVGREKILPHIKDLVNPSCVVVVDDTHRKDEYRLAMSISQLLDGKIQSHEHGKRKWCTIEC